MSKKAIVLVHFGTSYPEAIAKSLDPFMTDAAEKFPDFDIFEAYSSSFIRKALQRKHSIAKKSLEEVLTQLEAFAYDEVFIQPSVLMMGLEYEKLQETIASCESEFARLRLCKPLIYSNQDYTKLIDALAVEYQMVNTPDTAYVFMGHGSSHPSEAIYSALDHRFKHSGFSNAHVIALEGYPDMDAILMDLKSQKPDRVILIPLLIVAGDHAKNDMAGEGNDSLKSRFEGQGYHTEAILKGLGEISRVRALILEHILEEIN